MFLLFDETAQGRSVLDPGAGMGMFRRPASRVLAQTVEVVTRFARPFVFDAPGFFKNRASYEESPMSSRGVQSTGSRRSAAPCPARGR